MKQIPLTRGMFALVDDEDFKELSKYKWCAIRGKNTWYAMRKRRVGEAGRKKTCMMHRMILNVDDPNIFCDHKNGDGIDNRRCNLRQCSSSENGTNRPFQKNNTTGFKGVDFHKQRGKYRAIIQFKNKQYHIGLFQNAEDAARAYDEAARRLHGEFAHLNFPKP